LGAGRCEGHEVRAVERNGERAKANTFIIVRKIKNNMLCIQICCPEVTTPAKMIACFVPVMFRRSVPSTQVHYFSRAHSDRVGAIPMQGAAIDRNWNDFLRAAFLRDNKVLTSSSFFAFFDVFACASWPTCLSFEVDYKLINNKSILKSLISSSFS